MKKKYVTAISLMLLFPVWQLAGETSSDSGSQAEALIADLAHDDVRWNAEHAHWDLRAMDDPPIDLLEAALDSPDYQQRQFAAQILRYFDQEDPSMRLIEVTYEGLRDDQYPDGRDPARPTYNYLPNAAGGMRFLMKHHLKARKWLLRGLDSDDPQQRFLCAFVLGMNGVQDRLADTAAVLLLHLRDNDIPGDACMACPALYRLGPKVRPFLLAALDDADTQQEEAIRLLLLDFESPPETEDDLWRRLLMQNLTEHIFDPALEFDPFLNSWSFPDGIEKIKRAMGVGVPENR